jgi:hypothetical protein
MVVVLTVWFCLLMLRESMLRDETEELILIPLVKYPYVSERPLGQQ